MIKKRTGAEPLTEVNKSKLKAELYIFLQQKMNTCLQEAILLSHRSTLHSDIVTQYEHITSAREDKVAESFFETASQKFDRLAIEFDTVRDIENAERNFVNQLVDNPNSADKWEEFAQFCLRYGLQIKAEQCLYKMIECQGGDMDPDMRLFLASLMVQRKNYFEARNHLNQVLD